MSFLVRMLDMMFFRLDFSSLNIEEPMKNKLANQYLAEKASSPWADAEQITRVQRFIEWAHSEAPSLPPPTACYSDGDTINVEWVVDNRKVSADVYPYADISIWWYVERGTLTSCDELGTEWEDPFPSKVLADHLRKLI